MKDIYSFEEALKKAREVNKPIFVNCFADWAVPCHGMNQLVFSDQQFADWMDPVSYTHLYGIQGNMLEDQSPNLILRQGTINPMYNENISTVARYPNPNLKWEETRQFNVELDLSFLVNRIGINLSLIHI